MNSNEGTLRLINVLFGDGDAKVTLLFDGNYLRLLADGEEGVKWPARSGVPEDDWFDYNLEQQKKKDVGPILAGEFWIRPNQIVPVAWAQDSWGTFRVTIHYFNITETVRKRRLFYTWL